MLRARSLVADSARWVAWNRAAESLVTAGRGVRVSYEDFTADPRPAIERALTLVDFETSVDSFFEGSTVDLEATHTVWGNRSRFATGPVEIVDDRRWTTELAPWERRLATGLPRLWLSRYGY